MRYIFPILILFAPAMAYASEPTANRTIPRGTQITAAMVTGDATEILGLETTRTIRSGTVIEGHLIREPLAVERNQVVTVVYKSGSLTIETVGRALDEGSSGAQIRVMNLDSRKSIMGRITGPGEVEVG
jgi:flagella basal body P-ring formation protein FlgA